MPSSRVVVKLVATMVFLSIGFILFPQDPANAAKFCAELVGATATGHPDCSFSSLHACRAHIKAAAGGGGGGHCYKLRH
jgi:hypothetical protein